MSAIIPSITETNLMTALRGFILSVVDCEVIRTQVNRVAMPVGDFIALTALSGIPLSTNVTTYTSSTKSIERPTQWTVQIDCYGALANERAATISMLLRDNYACASFTTSGYDIQPLYADNAQQMPLIDGESQYLERWFFNAVLQYNPVITVNQDTANAIDVGLVSVDVVFKP
jgi:hypothetical protein